MYYSAIGLLAFLVLLVENQDIIFKRRSELSHPVWEAYRRFLFAVLLYYVTDILWGILEARKLSLALFTDTTVYFIVMAIGILSWTQYTVTYLDAPARFLLYAGRALAGVVTVLAIANIFTPILFTVDEACVYRALPPRYVLLVCQILMLLLISGHALSTMIRRRGEPKKNSRCLALALFGFIMALFLFVQLWYPYLPLYGIAYLLGTCLLHTFVVSDEKEEFKRDLREAAKITELKNTISSLLDNMPGMSFAKEATTGVYLACNQAFAEYAHKETPEGVAGLTDAQIFDPETAAHFVQDDRMALSMDEPYIFFEDVPDAVGNQRQFQTTKLKYTDMSGRLCILGMCQDVTDLVRVQRENATTREAYERARSTGIMFSHMARAMASSYTSLYYVDVDTDDFIEYRTDADRGELIEFRRGERFFEALRKDAERMIHSYDRDALLKAMNKRKLLETLERDNTFITTYRELRDNAPVYVTMKVSRMKDDHFIVIGVTNVDDQVKQQREAQRLQEEQIAYSRISALTGDYICIYLVVPESGRYREFSAKEGFDDFGVPKDGEDFFTSARENTKKIAHPDDIERFLSLFTRENVFSEIERRGIFSLTYRIMIRRKPVYVQLKAAMLTEKGGKRLIVGLNDIDSQVQQEEEYAKRLAKAQSEATIDALTGAKNRLAFANVQAQIDLRIAANAQQDFAIIVLDVNDLKKVNDTQGHQAGDLYIKSACSFICETFKHSPVFRVGGDEFAVIAQGRDYENIDTLIGKVNEHNKQARGSGEVVVACGMSRFDGDACVAPVFKRADENMYENKCILKGKPVKEKPDE
ncbi:MAG: diguanylate cyclase [Oscillospiraceae bacterium]|nr:diguanylate cyclase [Oscillospiraceae bacterium]